MLARSQLANRQPIPTAQTQVPYSVGSAGPRLLSHAAYWGACHGCAAGSPRCNCISIACEASLLLPVLSRCRTAWSGWTMRWATCRS